MIYLDTATADRSVGNDALRQMQLGTYGDLFDTIFRYTEAGHLLDARSVNLLAQLADLCCENWTREDSGIWELEQRRHYTISKMGCWVALDRASRLAHARQLPNERAKRWANAAADIRSWVVEDCWSEQHQTYTFYAGADGLDAPILLAGRTAFDRGARLRTSIEAVVEELAVPGTPLLYRYSGMDDEEGAFVACTFWLVDALTRTGQLDRAWDS